MAKSKRGRSSTDSSLAVYRMRVRDRVLTATSGFGLLTPAVVALQHGVDGSAVLGFTVLGGTGLLVAGIGSLPARAVIGRGKNAVTLHMAAAIETVVEALPGRELEEIVSQLAIEGSSDDYEAAVLEHASQQYFFKREMVDLIEKVALENGAEVETEVATQHGTRWDALISGRNTSVAVEIKTKIDLKAVERLRPRVGESDADLLLVGLKISPKAEAMLTTFPRPVVVLHSQDRVALEERLQSVVKNLAS
jgi:hypothetical protein